MFSQWRDQWVGNLKGNLATSYIAGSTAATSFQMTNGYMFQGRFGVRPMDKLDILAKVTYATAATTPTGAPGSPTLNYVGKDYGTEIDLIATYKITNNLSYMLGAGYLFTGDYFKGQNAANAVQNDFLVINKLTLTF